VKAVIPLGGKGTRLRPHTFTRPKALLHVAGKPALGHILDEVAAAGIMETVLIVGQMGEQIEEYVRSAYPRMTATFVEQREPLGLGHAVSLTRDAVGKEGALIIYGDTLFEADLRPQLSTRKDASLGTISCDDPRPFGIVERSGGRVTRLVEKPKEKKRGEVIVGVNVIRDSGGLYDALEELMRKNLRTKNEYQLTDAMQLMVEHGAAFTTFPVKRWLDCGSVDNMLASNAALLVRKGKVLAELAGSSVAAPCHVAKGAVIERSKIGPNVSIAEGAVIRNSVLKDCIIHESCVIENCVLDKSIIGGHAVVRGFRGSTSLGDFSSLAGSR